MRFVLAPGWVKTAEDARKFRAAPISAITMGSYTPKPMLGNQGGRNFHHDDDFNVVLNSIGLKNNGIEAGREEVAKVSAELAGSTINVHTSFAGFSVNDYTAFVESHAGASLPEFNFGCPNGFNADGTPKRIMSFDIRAMDAVLSRAEKVFAGGILKVQIKVSPYSDPYQLKDTAELFNAYSDLIAEVMPNTFPLCLAFNEDGTPFLEVSGGLGGLSGRCMKPITLGQVAQFRKHLHANVGVGAAGGMHNGIDVRDAKLAGASSVHIGSRAFVQGPRAIAQIVEEYAQYA